ncbi:MAG: YfiH family protein [Myxococcota bacterium]|jgi:YfiH family protein
MLMKQVEHQQLIGFSFEGRHFSDGNSAHVFGGRNAANAGNFAFSGGRDLAAAIKVRATWCDYLGCKPQHLIVGGQTHTANVEVVTSEHQSRGALSPSTVLPDCDGLITTVKGLPLYVAVADCSAVLLTAPGIVGVIHGGWRGLQQRILEVAVKKIVALGAEPQQIYAGIAPCISAGSYEVGPEVASDCPSAAKYKGRDDRWQVDVALWAQQQLLESGLEKSNIELSGIDSGSDQKIFSHRRQGTSAGRNGLLAILL